MSHTDRHGIAITAGYRMFTGRLMAQPDADAYNKFTDAIEAATYPPTQEFLKDQRHRLLVLLATEVRA